VYHWSVSPSAGTSFTVNNTNTSGASNTVMLFSTINSYTVTVTATDNSGSGPGVGTQTLTFTPGQTPTSIIIAPSSATVVTGNNQVFSATVYDQTGTGVIVGQPVNWTVSGGGSLSTANGTSTTFTATTPGTFMLKAIVGSAAEAAQITVVAAGPQVDSFGFVMSAGNKGGVLTIVGHDNVVHAVSSSFSSDPSVTFTPTSLSNIPDGQTGTSAVTFSKAGTFTLTDSLGSGVSTSTVVTVPQVLTSIKVCPVGEMTCPASITVETLQTQQFTATGLDQFGNSMPVSNVVWTSNGGNVNGAGAFDSPTIGNGIVVTATSNGKSGSITVNTVSFDVSGAYGYPVPCKANQGCTVVHFTGLGSQASLHIYTSSGRRIFDISLTSNVYDWPITNSSGESVASGVYFYVIQSSQGKKDGKLIIIK
jgi:hypothetical protein